MGEGMASDGMASDHFDTLIHAGRPADLPPRLQALLDPDRPLARPGHHLFTHPHGLVTLLRYGWLVLLGLGVLVFARSAWMAWQSWRAGDGHWAMIAIAGGGIAALVWLVIRAVRGIGGDRRLRAGLAAGRWREGFFVEPDGLLIHEAGVVYWLPKGRIRIRVDRPPELGSGAGGIIGRIAWLTPDGREHGRVLPEDSVAVGEALRRWQADEPFEPPRRPAQA